MKLIYQIGRLDAKSFENINFFYKDKEYSAQLSSFVLKEHFEENKEKSKVILIYPVSLLINKSFLNNTQFPEVLKNTINNILTNPENYFVNPRKYFMEHPHSKIADDFIIIHSIGQYEGINFFATLEDLILEIFIDLVSRYQKEPFSELYLDISSGHNIYVSALLEAGRLFFTFYKLQNFHSKNDDLQVYITFSDPILPPYDRKFMIREKFPLKVKAFFHYPETPHNNSLNDGYGAFAKLLTGEAKELRKKKNLLNELFSYGYFFYSAIKNNTPLVLYTWEYHPEEKIEEGISVISTLVKDRLTANYQTTPNLDFNLFSSAFLMLSLYKGIVRVLQTYNIFKKEEVSLTEIKSKFLGNDSLYRCFGLIQNIPYLSHEINNTFEKEPERGGINHLITEDYKLLREFIKGESDKINDRNFLAHCGFERNCVYVRKNEETLFIKYNKTELQKIEEILIKN
ncbi:TIGR01897 family CRISPR-associated protein [Thermodesulfobacterium sp. TA1]|uniref:CRISPR-associated CARF protein Csx1 n=1 Tax=Thermodesulfobacterium sp. TA1 TaxID=2234087 RepID=UPI001232C4BB|nr:CRISPR-associated CARF protein Csx1 [Thermodesulfobacterium sp. TA1]QER42723.1 TIGR01897 family CRISPR-associated protein [Thermodesulfobacterium sp. TA1]